MLNHLAQRATDSDAPCTVTAVGSAAVRLPAHALTLCRELQFLLQGDDARASRSAEIVAQHLQGTSHADAARQIASHAGRFDYGAASDSLRTLMASLA